jgi:hypothetical protein
LALDSTGNIWGWGNDENGQLGINLAPGQDAFTNLPTLVSGISNVIAIAAGYQHAIAIRADRTLWAWGDNSAGDLGQGFTGGNSTSPAQVVATLLSNNVAAIAGGNGFTLAVTSNGQVFAFGNNSDGQLGTNSADVGSVDSPMLVTGISHAVLVSANPSGGICGDGGYHSLAMSVGQGTNRYYGWGNNSDGQAGVGFAEGVNAYSADQVHFCNACSSCVQLGTSNVFTAQCTGTLKLYFNDDDNYEDNTGSYSVVISAVGSSSVSTSVVVAADNPYGVAAGIVTNAVSYSCIATGHCNYVPCDGSTPCGYDPDGKDYVHQFFDCTTADSGMARSVCPHSQCFSLVGRIQ